MVETKILCYNVAGINAAIKKGLVSFLSTTNADIVCLQETKLNEPVELLTSAYKYQYWSCCKSKKGYSGTAILSKIKPLKVFRSMDSDLDEEGRIVSLEFNDYYLINTYTPNAGQGLKRMDYKLSFNASFEKFLRNLERSKPVLWTGDLNVAHTEIDLARPKENTKTAGFTPQERDNFSAILAREPVLVDVWRSRNPEKQAYTYFSHRFNCKQKNLGWRLDYFVASQSLVPRIRECEIMADNWGPSDHCPLFLVLDSDGSDGAVVQESVTAQEPLEEKEEEQPKKKQKI